MGDGTEACLDRDDVSTGTVATFALFLRFSISYSFAALAAFAVRLFAFLCVLRVLGGEAFLG
jgi:hypothetical protein